MSATPVHKLIHTTEIRAKNLQISPLCLKGLKVVPNTSIHDNHEFWCRSATITTKSDHPQLNNSDVHEIQYIYIYMYSKGEKEREKQIHHLIKINLFWF